MTRGLSYELNIALEKLVSMREPSVEKILRKRGFGVEADVVKSVVDAFEKARKK